MLASESIQSDATKSLQGIFIQRIQKALSDFSQAITIYRLWAYLGWMDIQQRYRGSVIGPFWITLSMVIVIAALSIVYSRLLHQQLHDLIPFLTAGILAWGYMTTIIVESCDVFVSAKDLIENTRLPYMLHLMKLIWRNFLIFLHNFVVYVIVAIVFQIPIHWNIFLFFPGFILVSINLATVGLIIAIFGTRFRDLPPVISSLITVAFFVSPVTWQPAMLGERSLIILLNPFSYYLDLIRSPLLGVTPHFASLVFTLIATLVSLVFSLLIFARYRARIAFWL